MKVSVINFNYSAQGRRRIWQSGTVPEPVRMLGDDTLNGWDGQGRIVSGWKAGKLECLEARGLKGQLKADS
jgi:hypothetical protein